MKEGDKVKPLINLIMPGNKRLFKDTIVTVTKVIGDSIAIAGYPADYTINRCNFTEVEDFKVDETLTLSPNGSKRYNTGKPSFSHLSPEFILAMTDLMEVSASKYGKNNALLGQDLTTPLDSLFRHYIAFCSNEDDDKYSKKSHLVHVAINAMIAWYSLEYYPELDDRFKRKK